MVRTRWVTGPVIGSQLVGSGFGNGGGNSATLDFQNAKRKSMDWNSWLIVAVGSDGQSKFDTSFASPFASPFVSPVAFKVAVPGRTNVSCALFPPAVTRSTPPPLSLPPAFLHPSPVPRPPSSFPRHPGLPASRPVLLAPRPEALPPVTRRPSTAARSFSLPARGPAARDSTARCFSLPARGSGARGSTARCFSLPARGLWRPSSPPLSSLRPPYFTGLRASEC